MRKQQHRRRWTARIAGLVTVFSSLALAPPLPATAAAETDDVVLTQEGATNATIVWWSAENSPVPAFAAAEVQSYVARMSGAELAVEEKTIRPSADVEPVSSGLVIVTGSAQEGLDDLPHIPQGWIQSGANELADTEGDAFAITTVDDDKLALSGATHRATLYAAYELLERLGVRFFAPTFDFYEGNAEHVPQLATIATAPLEVVEEPAMQYRRKDVGGGYSHTPQNLPQLIDWMAKHRHNYLAYPYDLLGEGVAEYAMWREQLLPELARRGIEVEGGQHGYESWLPPDEYPQFYVDGYNVFDMTNPAAVQIYIDSIVAYLRARPEITVFDAWPPDGTRWPPAVMERFGNVPNAVAFLTNELDAVLEQELPYVTLESISYGRASEPPSPEYMYDDDVIVDIATASRSFEDPIFDSTDERNIELSQLPGRWREAGFEGVLGIYEYYRKQAFYSLPVVLPELMGQEIPHYASIGAQSIWSYSEPGDWITYELTHLLIARMMWDPALDSQELVQTYLAERYGTAQPHMAEYLRLVEQASRLRFGHHFGQSAVIAQARNGYVQAGEVLDAGLAAVPEDSPAAFLMQRLDWNADYAVAAIEISYHADLGDDAAEQEARDRMEQLVVAHRFDGVVVHNYYAIRKYRQGADRNASNWTYDLYRAHDAKGLAGLEVAGAQSLFVGAGAQPVEVTVGNFGDDPVDIEVGLDTPADWTSETVGTTVDPGQTSTVEIMIAYTGTQPSSAELTALIEAPDGVEVWNASSPPLHVDAVPAGDDVALALDAGTPSSPVLSTYEALTPAVSWADGAGYGWIGTAPAARNRGVPGVLRGDFVLSRRPATLRVAVPAGVHPVYLLCGDGSFTSGVTAVTVDGSEVANSGGTLGVGEFTWLSFELDGGAEGRSVDITLSGESGNYWRLNALVLG